MIDTQTGGSSPRRIRLANVVAALKVLQAEGRVSRADLARWLGLNRSSSSEIVAELLDRGLVREAEMGTRGTRGAGRPGILLELEPEAALFTGIEIGVEHLSAVTIDLTGAIRSQSKCAFDGVTTPPKEAVAEAVALAFEGMAPEILARVQGLGVSLPAHIRPDGRVGLAPLMGWRDLDLAALIRAALPRPVPLVLENDANAFALGDRYRHGEKGVTLVLLMETGIGGGILIDGKLFRGGHGLSGEIGHMSVPGSGGVELEQLIGREVLERRYRAEGGGDWGAFLQAVQDREPLAVSIAEDWARHLGHTLSQACRLIDPERIVLGGSVAALYPLVAARVAAHMVPRAVAFPLPQIVVEEGAEFGAAYGAACLLHQRFLTLETTMLDELTSR